MVEEFVVEGVVEVEMEGVVKVVFGVVIEEKVVVEAVDEVLD